MIIGTPSDKKSFTELGPASRSDSVDENKSKLTVNFGLQQLLPSFLLFCELSPMNHFLHLCKHALFHWRIKSEILQNIYANVEEILLKFLGRIRAILKKLF